jgi:methanethiol S-methyltransferase
MLRRASTIGYGILAYLAFLAVFTYTIGFLAGAGVPKAINDGTAGATWAALGLNAALLGLFAAQHTVMARPAFKRWCRQVIPASVERSTFVLAASLVLALVLWQWRPLTAELWSVGPTWARAALWVTYGFGWVMVVGSTFLIDHFDLFGLRQVVARARQRRYEPPGFREPLVYRFLRHPIMVGFLIAFWAAPDMTTGRLLFAALGTGYILIGVRFEEHDLAAEFGDRYARYLAEVPGFVPRLRPRTSARDPVTTDPSQPLGA